MLEVIGYKRNDFDTDDGKRITGVSVYLATNIVGDGEGKAVERVYLTDTKLQSCGYTPKVGDKVTTQYNRYGKVSAIAKM